VIDLHCHILPGIDDGPTTIEESVALARVAAGDGTRTMLATPHVSWEYPNTSQRIRRLVEQVNLRLHEEGIAVEVKGGAELAMTRINDLDAHELSRLTLGGGRWLLVEPPFAPVATGLDALISDLHQRGYRVVLAHPERCHALHRDRAMLERIVSSGALTSITAGSLDGKFGSAVARFARELLAEEMVHNVASDAHDPSRRAPTIAGELNRAGLGELAPWLTQAVPEAILSGGTVPPRPPIDLAPLLKRPSPLARLASLGRGRASGGDTHWTPAATAPGGARGSRRSR
jgi:protein-tyrosine phosphatase